MSGSKGRMVEQMHSLSPISSGVIIDAWQEKLDAMRKYLIEDVTECNTDDDYELPLELEPALMADGTPALPDDPNWVEEEYCDYDEADNDAFDLKNTPDFDPDQDWEAQFYLDEHDAWIKSDERESLSGARPRLYEKSSIPRGEHEQLVLHSEKYQDILPVTESSTFAPWLLIQQIPCKPEISIAESDAQFAVMFQRYAYLVSHEEYIRVTCFKQDNGSYPRWLLVQEFMTMWNVSEFNLKKQEVEYWWRKNGWTGVLPEFFKLRGTQRFG
ncbi:MAG: hypothetical protein Q9226_003861 [Calogaya cf. arnoldii]